MKKSKQRKAIADSISKHFTEMRSQQAGRTGSELLRIITGMEEEKASQDVDAVVETTTVENTVVENDTESAAVEIANNYHKVDNDVSDLLAPLQTTTEQSIYRRMYRLSYGFHKNTCRVGMGALGKACNISSSAKTVRKAVGGLIEKGHISIVQEHGNSKLGTLYRVYLPCEVSGIESRTMVKTTTVKNTMVNSSRSTVVENTVVENDTMRANGENKGTEPAVVENTVVENTGIKKGFYKDTLFLDLIVDLFYTGIGQTKISQEKREKGLKCIEELKADGFSEDDVAYAAQWTPDNATEKLYDFSIIKHTIGQALAVRAEEQKAEERRQEAARIAAEAEAEEARERQERRRVEEEKNKLPAAERKRLRLRAEQQLKDSGEFKPEYITEALIKSKENEIFKEEGGL